MQRLRSQRGDTLIEVLAAITVLSVIVTICYTVMTRSYAYGQTSLERNMTQNMLNGQVAILRDVFARHEQAARSATAEPAEWAAITDSYTTAVTNPTKTLSDARANCSTSGVGSGKQPFYFDPSAESTATTPHGFPKTGGALVRTSSYPLYGDGMWIEAYRFATTSGTSTTTYYDFYVKACWDAAIGGQRQEMQTTVRLYEQGNLTAVAAGGGGSGTPNMLNKPTVTAVGGNNTVFTATSEPCPAELALEYRYKTPSSEWTELGGNSSFTWYGTTVEAQTYTVYMQARCANATTSWQWSGSGTTSYIRPITAPPTGIITVAWTGNFTATTTELRVSGAVCPTGASPFYHVWVIRTGDGLSVRTYDEDGVTSTFSGMATGWQGYDYTGYAQVACRDSNSTGQYSSPVSTAVTSRPVDPPGAATNFSFQPSPRNNPTRVTVTWTGTSCGLGAQANLAVDYRTNTDSYHDNSSMPGPLSETIHLDGSPAWIRVTVRARCQNFATGRGSGVPVESTSSNYSLK